VQKIETHLKVTMKAQNKYPADRNPRPKSAENPAEKAAPMVAPTSKTPGDNPVKMPNPESKVAIDADKNTRAKVEAKPAPIVAPTGKTPGDKPVKTGDVPMHAASGDDDRMSDPQPNRPIPIVGAKK
jgi:hypothetical protein